MSHFSLDAFKIPSVSSVIVSLITVWPGVDFFALAFLQFVEFIGCTDYVSSNVGIFWPLFFKYTFAPLYLTAPSEISNMNM